VRQVGYLQGFRIKLNLNIFKIESIKFHRKVRLAQHKSTVSQDFAAVTDTCLVIGYKLSIIFYVIITVIKLILFLSKALEDKRIHAKF
jgi:hypothetical protein